MKLFLLKPKCLGQEHGAKVYPAPWKPWYDKAFGFVVRAESENDARALAQAAGGDEVYDASFIRGVPAWLNPEFSICEELLPEGEAQVILHDFAAA
jgi:hypothetical protein